MTLYHLTWLIVFTFLSLWGVAMVIGGPRWLERRLLEREALIDEDPWWSFEDEDHEGWEP